MVRQLVQPDRLQAHQGRLRHPDGARDGWRRGHRQLVERGTGTGVCRIELQHLPQHRLRLLRQPRQPQMVGVHPQRPGIARLARRHQAGDRHRFGVATLAGHQVCLRVLRAGVLRQQFGRRQHRLFRRLGLVALDQDLGLQREHVRMRRPDQHRLPDRRLRFRQPVDAHQRLGQHLPGGGRAGALLQGLLHQRDADLEILDAQQVLRRQHVGAQRMRQVAGRELPKGEEAFVHEPVALLRRDEPQPEDVRHARMDRHLGGRERRRKQRCEGLPHQDAGHADRVEHGGDQHPRQHEPGVPLRREQFFPLIVLGDEFGKIHAAGSVAVALALEVQLGQAQMRAALSATTAS